MNTEKNPLIDNARKLDALIEAFEGTYIRFIEIDCKRTLTKTERQERDRACAAFYLMKDIVNDFVKKLVYEEVFDKGISTKNKQGLEKRFSQDCEKQITNMNYSENKAPAKTNTTVDTPVQIGGCDARFLPKAKVVSMLGAVRIVNTEIGNFYSPVDIATICGSKNGLKWVANNMINDNKLGADVYEASVYDQCGSRRMPHKMNLVTQKGAEKIMDRLGCPPDVREWIDSKVFGYVFDVNAVKIKCVEIRHKVHGDDIKARKNTLTIKKGDLQINYS